MSILKYRIFNYVLAFMTAFTFCIQLYGQEEKPVTLRGKIINLGKTISLYDLSEYCYLTPVGENDRTIIADENGNFSISFLLKRPNYFAIQYNKLYLSPGDSMNIFIDGKDAGKAKFSGKGSEANTYLKATLFPAAGSYYNGGTDAKATFQESIDYIIQQSQLRQKELDTLQGVLKEFKRLEYARIKADVINSLKSWRYALMPLHIKSNDSTKYYKIQYDKLCEPIIKKYSNNFIDASFLKLNVYTYIANDLIKQKGNLADVRQIKDFYIALNVVDLIKEINSKSQILLSKNKIKKKMAAIKTLSYRSAANRTLSKYISSKKQGDIAGDFTAIAPNGEAKKLSSYSDKIIYVDIWATWCGPCMEQIPYLEKLKEKYRENKDIIFLSLSVDSDTSKWKEYLKTNNKSIEFQLNINTNALLEYNVTAIPRAILIDKNFKIINLFAALPSSSEEINRQIESALNKSIQ